MKDFEEMTNQEKDNLLKKINDLPEESIDSIDLFTKSFNELATDWSNSLKEFDTLYSNCKTETGIDLVEDNNKQKKWHSRFRNILR